MAGRPSTYTDDIADKICELLCEGMSLRQICEDEDMPNRATVFRWLSKNESFRDQYARAREEQAEAYADEIVQIADEKAVVVDVDEHGEVEIGLDPANIARNRLRVDARKWVASKLLPKKYGERVEHTGHLTLEQLVAGAARTPDPSPESKG